MIYSEEANCNMTILPCCSFYLDHARVTVHHSYFGCMIALIASFLLPLPSVGGGMNAGCYNVDAANAAETLLPVLLVP